MVENGKGDRFMKTRDDILKAIFKEDNGDVFPYAITSKKYGAKTFKTKELLMDYMKNNFSEKVLQNLKEWNEESDYQDEENELIIFTMK